MDSIFQLDDGGRATFLHHMLNSFAATYICLWSYLPHPSSCLISTDGLYTGEDNQASSSSGSRGARSLFDEYRQGIFVLGDDRRVPGLAFRNGDPYMELKELDLFGLSSIGPQLQFYQEARIKSAIFMGCNTGEIELGFSNATQVNLEMDMRSWFPDDFSRQRAPPIELPPTDQPGPSSSSSSLRSLSMGSPEASPFLYHIPTTSSPLQPPNIEPSSISEVVRPLSSATGLLHQSRQAFSLSQLPSTSQFPTPEATEAGASRKPSSFKRFRSALGPSTMTIRAGVRKPNIQKRAITFFRGLSLMRLQGQAQGSRPMSSTQLQHMISERKRREKLNESFQALRSFLPPGTKKDKASVLASTTDYLASLKALVEELTKRCRDLEEKAQLLVTQKKASDHDHQEESLPLDQRLDLRITHEAESTSQAQVIGLQVVLRGECNVMDLVTRILGFLRGVENASLLSVGADTQVVDSNPINVVRLRLRIEGGEWDESAFQEAVRRVVADMGQ